MILKQTLNRRLQRLFKEELHYGRRAAQKGVLKSLKYTMFSKQTTLKKIHQGTKFEWSVATEDQSERQSWSTKKEKIPKVFCKRNEQLADKKVTFIIGNTSI